MRNIMNRNFALFIVISIFLLSGCGPTVTKSVYLSSDFEPMQIDSIVVPLPLDLRINTNEEFGYWEKIQKGAINELKQRGYNVIKLSSIPENIPSVDEELNQIHPPWLKEVKIPSGRYLLIIGLVDFESRFTFGSLATAELTGYLYDLNKELMIWHNKGVGRDGQAGIAGMLLKPLVTDTAIRSSISLLMSGIPIKERD